MRKNITFLSAIFLLLIGGSFAQKPDHIIIPRHYVCYRVSEPISVDGLLNEPSWLNAEWTDYFVDIEGSKRQAPLFGTRVKMLWDDKYLYIAAFLEEPDVWATLTKRESVIFYDNDFEVFIDPDGDTHNYIEYEMNAFNTQWDLLLLKPYRDESDQNVAVDHWSINGMKSAVWVDGTINNGNDRDRGWYVEIAIPFDAIGELHSKPVPPADGEQYRINFSRVEWQTDWLNGEYVKKGITEKGKVHFLPENNWVWSEQGVVAMHQPETWGYLQFSTKKAGEGLSEFIPDPDAQIKQYLRDVYFTEKKYYDENKKYTNDIKLFNPEWPNIESVIVVTQNGYNASVGGYLIDETGKLSKK
jgi:hypothetical protein